MMHLLIRADMSPSMGGGHVMRSLALAQVWQACGGSVTFISHRGGETMHQLLGSARVGLIPTDYVHPHASDLSTVLSELDQLTNPWLIVDGYHFDSAYQLAIQNAGHRLLVIDDTAHQAPYHADILVNQNMNAQRLRYDCDVDTELLLGPRYVLLRREFLRWRHWRRQIPNVASKVLVTMGAADPENVTLKAIHALERLGIPGLEARVVVGPMNPHVEELRHVIRGLNPNVRLLTHVTDMAPLMAWADVAVSAAGSTCWEMAFMGLPSLLLITAENQIDNSRELDEASIAINLGWFSEVNEFDLENVLQDLSLDHERRTAVSKRGRRLVDGRGCEQVVSLLVAKRRGAVSFRNG